MIARSLLLGVVLVSPPALITATVLQGPDAPAGSARAPAGEVPDAAIVELESLRAELRAVRAQLEAAEAKCRKAAAGLEEALDLVEQGTEERQHRSNCTPLRSRALLTQYQWLRERGHDQRAERTLARAVDRIGDDRGRLNDVAWHLMTDEETAGRFDGAALALARRLQQQGELQHNQLDTVALACFLNGEVDEAIALQRQAIEQGGRGDDYRRRLRTYEAAAKHAVQSVSAADRERLAGGE